jgi:hypothetical protein
MPKPPEYELDADTDDSSFDDTDVTVELYEKMAAAHYGGIPGVVQPAVHVVHLKSFGRLGGKKPTGPMSWTDCEGLEKTFIDADDRGKIRYKCCGLNGRILLQQALTNGFAAVIADAKMGILSALQQNPKYVCHGFRCKHGQHRSVALLTFTASILKSLGYVVVSEHMCIRPCGCPGPAKCATLFGLNDSEIADTMGRWASDGVAAHAVAARLWDAASSP